MSDWTVERLRDFERNVKEAMQRGEVKGPVHLSGGNEDHLLAIFRDIRRTDWVLSTYRSHYHALLHGVPASYIWDEIMAGRSMSLHSWEYRFYTSAIVGGCLPIATGIAAALKRKGSQGRVWCFIGDMAASAGTFHDCEKYARLQDLPIKFVVEDNGMSTYTPTREAWGMERGALKCLRYHYTATEPHIGATTGAHL